MNSSVGRTLGVFLLLLCVFGSCWITPRDGPVNGLIQVPEWRKRDTDLLVRQTIDCTNDLGDEDVPDCEALCAPSSYSCSNTDLNKRYLNYLQNWPLKVSNETVYVRRAFNAPVKRAFTTITQSDVQTYLPNQFNGNFDPTFGVPQALVQVVDDEETDATVVVQQEFENAPFAIGSQSLHGCTMVTIVSTRAVYMGHFWEIPSWSSTTTIFNENVLYFFSGGNNFGVGPQLNPALFTSSVTDDTRVYIMTPRRTGGQYTTSNYRAKVPQLIAAIQTALGNPNVPIAVWKYVRLNYDEAGVEAAANTNQRGIALFQFDPNAYGAGQQGWRLFYEEMQFSSRDPPPGPASVDGIPPLPPLPGNAA